MNYKKYISFVILCSFIFSLFGVLLEYYYLKSKNMAEPVWGQLAKAQDDNETIEEALVRLIAEHETNAGAHTGAGEALETHKTQVIVDHPAGSIVEDKLPDSVITTPKINDLAVTEGKIGNLAVTNAKINDLNADKITAGTITSKAITLAISAGQGDVKIQAGKTDFGDNTEGFILGIDDSDGDKAKFEIGNATDYIKWDGSNVKILCSSENAIHVQYGSDILLEHGGDIKFTSVGSANCLTMGADLIETSGNVDIGLHHYQVTFINEAGETSIYIPYYKAATTNATHRQVALSAIPISISKSVTARKIYRTKLGDQQKYYLLATLNDNTTTIYTDNTADANLTGENAAKMENSSFGKIFIDDLASLRLGSLNSFVGQYSGNNNTTGYENTAIGVGTLRYNTIGFSNTAVGYLALNYAGASVGSENVAVGAEALGFNNRGDHNIAIGYQALYYNSTPSNNTAIGYKALHLTNLGDGNIGIGAYAGRRSSTEDKFFVNNRDRTDSTGDSTKSLLYGIMDDDAVDQRLKVNAYFAQSNHENITAYAGGGQANAVVITGNVAEIGVCASAGDSVALPWATGTHEIGMQIMIINNGANSCDVFPTTDTDLNHKINGSTGAKALAVNASMLCTCFSDYEWECVTLAR